MWQPLRMSAKELRLDLTLVCGQSFRWRQGATDSEWTGVVDSTVVSLRQTDVHSDVDFRVVHSLERSLQPSQMTMRLRDYFHADQVCLVDHYRKWSALDRHFAAQAALLPGLRILRQDPLETLFAFICSSNNHISRISSMISKLCSGYGERIDDDWHAFPAPAALAGESVERELRELGFGYRAKFIVGTARMLVEKGGRDWLMGLREMGETEARIALQTLPGVGPKVADCVMLMALDKHACVPVDTHMWQVAQRHYGAKGTGKTLSRAVYVETQRRFTELFGVYAGWAQTVLFSGDLARFSDRAAQVRLEKRPNADELKGESRKRQRKSSVD